jgi:hypothetical protein
MKMKHHVLIANDQFEDRHVERIGASLGAWATWERVAQSLPEMAGLMFGRNAWGNIAI